MANIAFSRLSSVCAACMVGALSLFFPTSAALSQATAQANQVPLLSDSALSGTMARHLGSISSMKLSAAPSGTAAMRALAMGATPSCTGGGAGTVVNLSGNYNLIGITTDGKSFSNGGLDGEGFAYSANLLTSGSNDVGTQFLFGNPDVANVVYGAGQTIALPQGQFAYLQLLGVGVNGDQANQPFIVTYTDGTTATSNLTLTDWYGLASQIQMAYRNESNGNADVHYVGLGFFNIALDSSKTVRSLTLPQNRNVVVLAATLKFEQTATDITPASNVTGIYTDGTTFSASSSLDGIFSLYSASTFGDTVTGSGGGDIDAALFYVGKANIPNAVFGAGQTLSFGSGTKAAQLELLGTAVNGIQRTQQISVTYSDGSADNFTQSFSDWGTPGSFPNEATVDAGHRTNADGTVSSTDFYVHAYVFGLNPAKAVVGVTLPDNRNVVFLGLTFDQGPALNCPTAAAITAMR